MIRKGMYLLAVLAIGCGGEGGGGSITPPPAPPPVVILNGLAVQVDSARMSTVDSSWAVLVGVNSDNSKVYGLKASWLLVAKDGSVAALGDQGVPTDSAWVKASQSGIYNVQALYSGAGNMNALTPIDIHMPLVRARTSPSGICTRVGTRNSYTVIAVDSMMDTLSTGPVKWAMTDSLAVPIGTAMAVLDSTGALTSKGQGHFYVQARFSVAYQGSEYPMTVYGSVVVDPAPIGQPMTCNYNLLVKTDRLSTGKWK